ncbi:Ig-like domain-containing protein, partial [Cellulophaga sp. E6(2014)]|uniref:Ig-like domain-containing protein n=1 Tax=Cellulophaga sp. E6(2014) TaxID=1495334 RepID=UPI00051CDF0A
EQDSSNNSIDVASEISDGDGDTLTVTIGSPLNGTAAISGTIITYSPTSGYSGNDQITYTINDGNGGIDSGLINITVNNSITFNQNTGLYIAPARSVVTIDMITEAYDKGNVTLEVHTEPNKSGTQILVPSIFYGWDIDSGDSGAVEDSGSFIMPDSGQVYFSGIHIDVVSDTNYSSTYVTINNNEGDTKYAIMEEETKIQ